MSFLRFRPRFADTEISQPSQPKSDGKPTRGGKAFALSEIFAQTRWNKSAQNHLALRKERLIGLLSTVENVEPTLVGRIKQSHDQLSLTLIAAAVFSTLSKQHGESLARSQVDGAMHTPSEPSRRWFTATPQQSSKR